MYGRVRKASSLLAWASRVAPSHALNGRGWESVVRAGAPHPAGAGAPAPETPSRPPLREGGRPDHCWEPAARWPLHHHLNDLNHLNYHNYHHQVATFASKGGAKAGQGGRAAAGGGRGAADRRLPAAAEEDAEVLQFELEPFVGQMRAALDALQRELSSIRTGRASPGLLEAVVVGDCSHGSHVPLRGLGTVVVRNPHLLVVEVYDPKDAQPVAAAIQTSPLKLQARVEGNEVLVELPRLTLDMVERMAKLAAQEAEAARAEVRRARHRALELARKVAAAGGVSKEEARRRELQIQAATDAHISQVDSLLRAKEKDLREKH